MPLLLLDEGGGLGFYLVGADDRPSRRGARRRRCPGDAGPLAQVHQDALGVGGICLSQRGDRPAVQLADATSQRQALAQELSAEIRPEQDYCPRVCPLHGDADGRSGSTAVERFRQDQHANCQPRDQGGDLQAMREFREQLTCIGKIVDLVRGWRQIGRFASHHQEVHVLND